MSPNAYVARALGFQGGQVLSLRVPRTELEHAARRRSRRAASAGTRSRPPTAPCSSTSARSSTCAWSPTSTASASRLSCAPRPLQRARPRALPARALARAHAGDRRAGCAATRTWASTARSGSRSARRGGAGRRRRRRALAARDRRRSAPPTPISTSIKLAIGRKRPAVEDLPHLMATPTGLSFPSSHSTSSFAAARAYGALLPGRAAAARGRRDGALAPLPRRPLPVRRRRRRGARHASSGASADDEGRPRGDAQRGQVLAVQRAQPGRAPRRRTTRSRRSSPTSPSCRSPTSGWTRSRRRSAPRTSSGTRSSSTTSPASSRGAHKGEGLGNKFLANIRECDALLHVVRAHNDDNVIHPEGRVDPARDIETIETELLFADLEQAERRHARVVREARSGDRAAVAEEAWLRAGDRGAAGRAARRAPCRSRTTRPTRCATCPR